MDGTDHQYALKWNNFQSTLSTAFYNLLKQELMVDVTLAVEGKCLQAHKMILSVCSPYFNELFNLNPCKHPIVILKDVGYKEMVDVLDFMYKGEASIKQEELPAFLKLAETLKLKGLGDEKILGENEDPIDHIGKKPKSELNVDDFLLEINSIVGNEQRTRKRKISPSPKIESVRPSTSNTRKESNELGNIKIKEEILDPEELQIDDEKTEDEDDEPLVQLINQKRVKQEVSEEQSDINDVRQLLYQEQELRVSENTTDRDPQISIMSRPTIYMYYLKNPNGESAKCKICDNSFRTNRGSTGLLHRHLKNSHYNYWKNYNNTRCQYSQQWGSLITNYLTK